MKLHSIDHEVLTSAIEPLRAYTGKDPASLPENDSIKYAGLLAAGAQKLLASAKEKGYPLTASEAVTILTNQLAHPSFAEKTPEDQGAFWAAKITEAREAAAAQGRSLSYAEAAEAACARVAMGSGYGANLATVVEVVR